MIPCPFIRRPECSWQGHEDELAVSTFGIFRGLQSCPECDAMEGHLVEIAGLLPAPSQEQP